MLTSMNTSDDPSQNNYVREAPLLIVEVLSSHTRRQDKTEKRTEYLSLPSLQEYVLIEQDIVEIEVQRRREAWRSSYYYLGQALVLESIGLELPVAAIYEKVENNDMQAHLARQNRED